MVHTSSTSTSTLPSIANLFDSICFAQGEKDAIIGPPGFQPLCYHELQHSSVALASQLYHRYRPTHVLLDLKNVAAAEAVAMLACIRIAVPFVPVSVKDYHAGDRLAAVVSTIRKTNTKSPPPVPARIVAVVQCNDDTDSILTKFQSQNVNVHNIIYVNSNGDMLEPMDVPSLPPFPSSSATPTCSDDLYILFTSGTTGKAPKAVVGSHKSTLHRLTWFAAKFPSSPNTIVARRSKLTFIDSVTELFSALLFPPAVIYDLGGEELALRGVSILLDSPCTRVTMLPSQLSQLLILCSSSTSQQNNVQNCLEIIIISGEICPVTLLSRFKTTFPSTMLINMYGQTESTGDVTCAILTDMEHPVVDGVVAVGWPIPGVTMSTHSDNTNSGTCSEIVVSGNLSNGYLRNSSTTTATTRTPASFSLFSTGDTGFRRVDGCWFVRGRVDDAAKINGILTLPSEVEASFLVVHSLVPCNMVAAAIVDGIVYLVLDTKINAFLDSIGLTNQEYSYSRESMREAGVPWNLIPKRVFQASIPTSGEAGKIDRTGVRNVIKALLLSSRNKPTEMRSTIEKDTLSSILMDVLGMTVKMGDDSSSFVELGGDSALAVTLLYKLKVTGLCQSEKLTATDILETENIEELKHLLSEESLPKRKRLEASTIQQSKTFEPQGIKRISNNHFGVEFFACVDSPPLAHGNSIYGVCQGGIIQRILLGKGQEQELAGFYNVGCKVQAGMVVAGNSLIVCGYNREEGSGTITAVDLDLSGKKWTKKVEGMIKSTPIVVDGSIYAVAGRCLHLIHPEDGKDIALLELPSMTESKAAIVTRAGCPAAVYAFSDWDIGLVVVEKCGLQLTIVKDITSPVYADLLAFNDHRVIACDISGNMFDLNVETLQVKSTRLTRKPIFSSPVKLNNKVVFGCHDGIIRCVNPSNLDEIFWQFDAKAVVYSKCWPSHNVDEIIAGTTAGDIFVLKKGEAIRQYKVDGEVWSDVMLYRSHESSSTLLAVGSRDSRLHIINVQ